MEDEFIDQFLYMLSEAFENEPDIDIDIDVDLGDYTNISEHQIDVASGQASENTENIEAIISHNFTQTISFVGNYRDENAPKFLAKCAEYGIDINESFDRDPGGGILYGQKNSILLKLNDAKDAGKITQAQYDELSSLFYNS